MIYTPFHSFMLHFSAFLYYGAVSHFGVCYETLLKGCDTLLKDILIVPCGSPYGYGNRIRSFAGQQLETGFIEGIKGNV